MNQPAFEMNDMRTRLSEADYTKIFFTDLNGRPKSLSVNPEDIESLIERGVGFDGSSIPGIAWVDYSDRILRPVPESLKLVKFPTESLGFFIGRIFNDRLERARTDPRAVLEKVLDQAESEFGCRFLAGPEYEFFLLNGDRFNQDIHSDRAGYFHSHPSDRGEPVRKQIVDILSGCGIKTEKHHHEVTASQHEINLECSDPLESADRTVLFVHVTQKIAAAHGFHATFMPKPFDGQNRNAFHIHLSMLDQEGHNVFYQPGDQHNLSPTALHFMGGIVKYAREASLIMASTFNSYKAYVLEREAPVIKGWGVRNRSSMVRVPYAGSPEATRIELRCPDPSGNVYLQMAVLIGMGLMGIRERADPGRPDVGSVYKKELSPRVWDERFLPKCMFEALVEAEKSSFLKDLLGKKIFDNYLALKIVDWEEHRTHVTPMEHSKYLTV